MPRTVPLVRTAIVVGLALLGAASPATAAGEAVDDVLVERTAHREDRSSPNWSATFEDSAIFPPYEGVLTEGNGGAATTTLVDAPGKGGRALRLVMPPSQGIRRNVPNRKQLHPAGDPSWRDGSDAWYGISLYVGDDWDFDDVADDRGQFTTLLSLRWADISHRDNGPGGGIKMARVPGDSRPHFVAERETRGWSFRDGAEKDQIDIGPVEKNRWIDFVVHIRWSASSRGGIREYWRDGELMGRSTNQNMGTDSRVIHRMGLYQGTAVDQRRTIYWDNHRIGRSYAEVDPSRD